MNRMFGGITMKDKVMYWIEIAEYDLETAEAMLNTKRYLYVGFMCHQTVEKLLKAYYVYAKQSHAPRTHNLSLLAEDCGVYKQLDEEQKDFLDLLEPLNIEARYPTDKERIMKSLNNERCQSILKNTKEMAKWIKAKL